MSNPLLAEVTELSDGCAEIIMKQSAIQTYQDNTPPTCIEMSNSTAVRSFPKNLKKNNYNKKKILSCQIKVNKKNRNE